MKEVEKYMQDKTFMLQLQAWKRKQDKVATPTAMQLAAWIDGRLDEKSAMEVEHALAIDQGLLDSLLQLRQSEHLQASAQEIAAARALVANQNQASWWQELLQSLMQPAIAMSTVATLIIVGPGGFSLGMEIAGTTMEQNQVIMNGLLGDELLLNSVEG